MRAALGSLDQVWKRSIETTRDNTGREPTRAGRDLTSIRSSPPPAPGPAKQMRVLEMQQQQSERGASQEEKRPPGREKATLA